MKPLSKVLLPLLAVPVLFGASANQPPGLLNDLLDISSDFHDYTNTYFLADRLLGFDPVKGEGTVVWRRNELAPRIAFSNMEAVLQTFGGNTFPDREYAVDPALPFSIQFVSPRTVRIRMKTGVQVRPDAPSLMLVAVALSRRIAGGRCRGEGAGRRLGRLRHVGLRRLALR